MTIQTPDNMLEGRIARLEKDAEDSIPKLAQRIAALEVILIIIAEKFSSTANIINENLFRSPK